MRLLRSLIYSPLHALAYLVPLGIMGLIYWFSAKPGDVSGSQSMALIQQGISWILPHFAEPCRSHLAESLQTPVRKLAHFTIYAVLCLSWIVAFRIQHMHRPFWIIVAIALSVLFAVCDEYHQSFVAGRAASVMDVGIDTAGVLLVALIASWRTSRRSS